MAGLTTTVYNLLFKRTSTYALTVVAATFFFERAFDVGAETFYEKHNEGVRIPTSFDLALFIFLIVRILLIEMFLQVLKGSVGSQEVGNPKLGRLGRPKSGILSMPCRSVKTE